MTVRGCVVSRRDERHRVPKYLYLSDPGSRWQLANDVDIVELRRQLDDARLATIQTEVMVDGLRSPLTIRRDQAGEYAVVETPRMRPEPRGGSGSV
jgi:hypothetical protein